jgi:tetratricopeptide (TPR) repeat protein
MEKRPPLVLEVLKIDSSLKMSLFEHSDFAQTLRHYSQKKVSFNQVSDVCSEFVAILNKAKKKETADEGPLKNLKKAGEVLWDQLLTKSVKDKIRSCAGADLMLSLDEELINIPWELLYDGEDFLCLKLNVGRILRTKQLEPSPQYRSAGSRLKMLILSDPTADLQSAYKEGLAIRNTLDSRRSQLSIDFKSTKIDTLYVKKNLGDYDIVHYAGHCEYDRQDPENSGWILSDARLTCRDIMTMGESFSMPSLMFSNSCQSALASEPVLCPDYQEKTYGIASSFLFSGVRHYIGATQRIEDPVSLVYAKEFYKILRRGRSIGESVRVSRMRLVREYGLNALYWASYLLYGDPGFVLFRKPGSSAGAAQTEMPVVSWARRYRKALIMAGCCIVALAIAAGLYAWLPSVNPNNYFILHTARRDLAAGRNEKAAAIGEKLLAKNKRMIAAYPVMAEANTRMGKRALALQNYFDYAVAADRAGDFRAVAFAYSMIGWLYQQQGNFTKAFDFYQKSLEQSRNNRDRLNEAIAMRKLAVWYMDKEDNDKALELLTRSSEINRERASNPDHRYNLACDYFDLGLLFSNKDDLATAKDFYRKSLRLFERMNKRSEQSDYYFNLGEISMMEKEYVKALDHYSKGLMIDQAQNNLPSISQDYTMIGELYMEMDNLDKAEEYFNKSIELCGQINSPPEFAAASYDLGLLYKKRGRKNKAREYLRQAQEIYAVADYPGYDELKKELLSLDAPM